MLDLSEKYNLEVSLEHRRRFAQFFTNQVIAEFMIEWAVGKGARSIYDPAFGLGVFLKTAKEKSNDISFFGSEIDGNLLEFLSRHSSLLNSANIEQEDYLLNWGKTHESIICNPPYMRFQLFENREVVFKLFEKHLGYKISGYTNIASAFLLKSLFELRKGGRLAYIMPLEFLNTGYGELIKRALLEQSALKAIIRIDCEKDAFPDVTTTVGIILVEKNSERSAVGFFNISDLSSLPSILNTVPARSIAVDELNPSDKWLNLFEQDKTGLLSDDLVRLDTFGSFSRGIATGANEFFLLPPEKVHKLGIPEKSTKFCISKSNQITSNVFHESHLKTLLKSNASVLLLDLKEPLETSEMKYIRFGEQKGYHERYLTKSRNPWFKVEKRQPAPLLFGVFSRNGFKVIRNFTNALNLTCFHGFYPNLFGENLVDHLFLYFNSAVAGHILRLNGRKYGDNLDKFEPNDLNNALVPSADWFQKRSSLFSQEAVEFTFKNGSLPPLLEKEFDHLLTKNTYV